jgi:hypothetical protein
MSRLNLWMCRLAGKYIFYDLPATRNTQLAQGRHKQRHIVMHLRQILL